METMNKIFKMICFLSSVTILLGQQYETENKLNLINDAEIPVSHEKNLFQWDTFTNNFAGTRSWMEENGFSMEISYTGESFSNLSGGNSKGMDYLDNTNITFSFDLEKLIGFQSAEMFLYILGNNGGVPCEKVGAGQGISNIAAPNTWKLYEAYIQKEFLQGDLSLLLGLFDYNSEFDNRAISSVFINPSHGIGPDISQSGQNGPSIFPTTSLAFRIKYLLTPELYLQTAVFDGVPGNPENPYGTQVKFNNSDGLFIALETGLNYGEEELTDSYAKYSLGAWYYTTPSDKLIENDLNGDPIKSNNFGVYLSLEKFLLSKTKNPDQGLAGFLRLGYANATVNQFDVYWGTGFTFTGLFSDNDVLGAAIGTAHNSFSYRESTKAEGYQTHETEIDLELTYSVNLTPWLRIQPDLQYVINPSDCYINNSALVFGTRFEITF